MTTTPCFLLLEAERVGVGNVYGIVAGHETICCLHVEEEVISVICKWKIRQVVSFQFLGFSSATHTNSSFACLVYFCDGVGFTVE